MSAPLRRSLVTLAMLVACAAATSAQSPNDVRLDIQSTQAARIPLRCESISPAGDAAARTTSVQADEVLASDLQFSGVFNVVKGWSGTASALAPEAIVTGKWTQTGSQIRFTGEVRDFPAKRPILTKEYRGTLAEWRSLVHQFADDVVLQFTGEPGVSSTRIAFIAQDGRAKELAVMDFDGQGVRPLTGDKSIAQSPSWSPDGSLLLFTSFRDGAGPRVHVLSASNRRIYLISGRPGINTGGQYSPDGREIVCTLSVDGNAEVYVLDARGGQPRRLTNHRGIDTSPTWSPTGQQIAFTSDRSGQPQVYVMDREGGNVRRLTYEADYTDSPSWSPKGDAVAFVSRTSGGFDLFVCRPDGSAVRRIVSGGSNENPRWSPDGRQIVFASNRDGTRSLWVTTLDGAPPRKLDTGGRKALSPAWSPRMTLTSTR